MRGFWINFAAGLSLAVAAGCSHSGAPVQTSTGASTSAGSTGGSASTTSSGTTGGGGSTTGSASSSGGSSSASGGSTGGISDGGDGGCSCPHNQYCDPLDAGRCLVCLGDSDCGPNQPVCDENPTSIYYGLCVGCTAVESFCATGLVCDRIASTAAFESCVADCRLSDAGAPCPADPSKGNWQHCDQATGVCLPGCLSQNDCPQAFPYCTPTGGCEECRNGGDCPYSNPGCHYGVCGSCVTAGDCRPGQACSGGSCLCASAGQCGGDAPVCERSSQTAQYGWCGCSSASDCTAQEGVCESSLVYPTHVAGACVPSCADGGTDCLLRVFPFNYCDESTGLCATCTSDGQCVGDAGLGGPHCLSAGYCGCLGTSDCPAGTACDPLFSQCEPSCTNYPGQCLLGSVCNPSTGLCVQCLQDADCAALAPATPYCDNDVDAGTTCVECLAPSACPSDAIGCSSRTFTCGSCEQDADCPSTYPHCVGAPGGYCA